MVGTEVLQNHWTTYSSGCRDDGREPDLQNWSVSRNVFVADTTEEARRLALADFCQVLFGLNEFINIQ